MISPSSGRRRSGLRAGEPERRHSTAGQGGEGLARTLSAMLLACALVEAGRTWHRTWASRTLLSGLGSEVGRGLRWRRGVRVTSHGNAQTRNRKHASVGCAKYVLTVTMYVSRYSYTHVTRTRRTRETERSDELANWPTRDLPPLLNTRYAAWSHGSPSGILHAECLSFSRIFNASGAGVPG